MATNPNRAKEPEHLSLGPDAVIPLENIAAVIFTPEGARVHLKYPVAGEHSLFIKGLTRKGYFSMVNGDPF